MEPLWFHVLGAQGLGDVLQRLHDDRSVHFSAIEFVNPVKPWRAL
jgi:hypothetical protein